MSMIYLSCAALEQLDQAQAEIDRHVTANAAGLCVTCGELEPCRARVSAIAIVVKLGRLPRRRPGLAGVLTAAASRTKVDWFRR